MRSRIGACLFIAHFVLMLLASTNLTIVSWIWGEGAWTWNYIQYTYRDGWGYVYRSDYSLHQVLLYLAAYGTGLVVYPILWRHRVYLSGLAFVVCLLGAVSFGLELTHWFMDHHLCWIASVPGAVVVLWICIAIQLLWRARQREQAQV